MTIVVKIGGGAGIDPEPLLLEIAQRRDVVLVHGASDEANRLSEQLGRPPRFVTSVSGQVSRFTDRETLEIFAMASARNNLRLVERLHQLGANAVGLNGVSGGLLSGTWKDHVKTAEGGKRIVLRGDHTGTVERVNADLLRLLLASSYVPVVGVPILGRNESGASAVNADADRAAAAIAGALKADALVILSNVPGMLRDLEDPASVVRRIPAGELAATAEKYAQGRFKKKVMAAAEALALGLPRVVLASANVPAPLARALAGEGTTIHRPEVTN